MSLSGVIGSKPDEGGHGVAAGREAAALDGVGEGLPRHRLDVRDLAEPAELEQARARAGLPDHALHVAPREVHGHERRPREPVGLLEPFQLPIDPGDDPIVRGGAPRAIAPPGLQPLAPLPAPPAWSRPRGRGPISSPRS